LEIKKNVGGCINKSCDPPSYVITSGSVGYKIKYMIDHAIIYKFLGMWPYEAVKKWWVMTHWKLKGDVNLKLGEKYFSTISFFCAYDIWSIF
jgi:hypothetical protein